MENIFKKDVLSILAESADLDGLDMDDVGDDINDQIDEYIDGSALDDLYGNCETVEDDDIAYTEEMVVVVQKDDKYLIEHDNLAKYMASNYCSIKEAMENICEHNSIPFENIYLIIENENTLKDALYEAQCTCKKCKDNDTKKKIIDKVKKSTKQLSKLKDDGIKVMKKSK